MGPGVAPEVTIGLFARRDVATRVARRNRIRRPYARLPARRWVPTGGPKSPHALLAPLLAPDARNVATAAVDGARPGDPTVRQPRITRQAAYLVATTATVAALLLGATALVVRGQMEAVSADHYESLQAIGRLRVAQVTAWLEERTGDLRAAAGSPFVAEAITDWRADPADAARRARIDEQLHLTQDAEHSENVLLLDPDGRLLASAVPDHAVVGADTLRLARSVLASGAEVRAGTVVYPDGDDTVHVDIAAAVRDQSGKPVGILVLRSDPAASLYANLITWPTTSRTGETLLVYREGESAVFLTIPRLAGETPPEGVPLSRVELPAVQAVLGRTGRFEGRDYRGVDVMADLRPVPETEWFLVDKMDLAEVRDDALGRAGLVVMLAASTIVLVGGLATLLFIVRRRSILRRLDKVEGQRTAAVARFDYLFANARDAFMILDQSGVIVEANIAAVELYGYPRDELLGMTVWDLRAPETRGLTDRDWKSGGLANGTLFETVHERQDGTRILVEISSRVVEIDEQPYRQSIIRDITGRKAAERALHEQLDELRRWNEVTLGREARVIDLKREVNRLLNALGRPRRYEEEPAATDQGGDG